MKKFPKEIVEKAAQITGKRARVVVDHILKHGSITTRDLRDLYGYDHPPRAIKDVSDQGLPLQRTMIKSESGSRMAKYTFGKPSEVRGGHFSGRKAVSKKFKASLEEAYGTACGICGVKLDARYLQVDHRVPYEVAGESVQDKVGDFMLLCASCNRAKSWTCESCKNRTSLQDPSVCLSCYWAKPDEYTHIALEDIRRIALVWQGVEVRTHSDLERMAEERGETIAEFVKFLLEQASQDQ